MKKAHIATTAIAFLGAVAAWFAALSDLMSTFIIPNAIMIAITLAAASITVWTAKLAAD